MGESPKDTIDVLVVDDNCGVRAVLAAELRDTVESSDVDVYECADGKEAYGMISDRSVVVLDLDMPDCPADGFYVLRRLEEEGVRPRGIAVIGSKAGDAKSGEDLKRRVREIYTSEVDFFPKPEPFNFENASQWLEELRAWTSCKVYDC